MHHFEYDVEKDTHIKSHVIQNNQIMILMILTKVGQKMARVYPLKIQPIINKWILKGLGAKLLGKTSIIGKCLFTIGRNSQILIGNNFHLVSTSYVNPLCQSHARIAVFGNAVLQIGDNVGMSSSTILVRRSIVIGNNVNIGGGVILMDTDAHSLNYLDRRVSEMDMANRTDKGIVIEDDVLVGAYSIILKGVRIGARSVIGAGSVVTKDVPADCIAAGNPAKVIKYLNNEDCK